MKTYQPVGNVVYLPDSYWCCYSDDNFCPNSLRNDTSSADLMDVDGIDSRNEEVAAKDVAIGSIDEEPEGAVDSVNGEGEVFEPARASCTELLAAAVNSDDEPDKPIAGSLPEESSMATDDDELDKATTPRVQRRRPRLVMSGTVLDLSPTVDLTKASDSDSSTSSEGESESESDEDSDGEDEIVIRRIVSAPGPSSWENDYLPVDQVDRMIRSQMVEIEAKKPWCFVFRCLEVPFTFKQSEDPFDVFFMRWDEFWRVHGRAVWERNFWQPLLPGSTESHRRKRRQFKAMCAFRELASDLMDAKKKRGDNDYCHELGKKLHEGWWYRTEPFRLRRLFFKKRQHYAEYLSTRVKLRWPRGKKFLAKRGLKPIWWLPDYRPPATDVQSEK